MHQQSRPPARVTSPTSGVQGLGRPTGSRDGATPTGNRSRAGSEAANTTQPAPGVSESLESNPSGPSRESIKKLDQIIQNFCTKAAIIIVQSRMRVTPARRMNKWFQIDTEDIEDFKEELRIFKNCGSFEHRPPPLVIETYIDAAKLTSSQSLVILDEDGKRWDVLEALNSSDHSDSTTPEVILERWRIELRGAPNESGDDFGPTLPTIYKKAIVFFRSLFMATRVLPAWKFSQHSRAKGAHPTLEVKCRIVLGEVERRGPDALRQALFQGRGEVVTEYMFGDLEVPVGRLCTSVTYRNDCTFRVDDTEALLSSGFIGADEHMFKPSLPQRSPGRGRDSFTEIGSLPAHRAGRDMPGSPLQTYGSLSTFHGQGPLGTSPISALRAVRPAGSDTSSPPGSTPASVGQDPPPHSLPIRTTAARPGIRPLDGIARRPSVSFQPFKAGSLSGSPVPKLQDNEAPASPHSLTRGSGYSALMQARNRTSLTAGMPASLRGAPAAGLDRDMAGSPKPASTSRYSSSFTHRRGRLSFGGASKAGDDDQGSSGKQSLASSVAQPGSGFLAEAGGGAASSGSLQTDDDNISEFIKALDSKKTLQSFDPNHARNRSGSEAAQRRQAGVAAQLSKFAMMRESHNALTESMTSSMHPQQSSGSSSRQLTSVPGMIAASMSTGSSPGGKPLSPHTPHTPAVPSRLSAGSTADYQTAAERIVSPRSGGGAAPRRVVPPEIVAEAADDDDDDDEAEHEDDEENDADDDDDKGSTATGPSTAANNTAATQGTATAAIDIPVSPRLAGHRHLSAAAHSSRRASSAAGIHGAHRHRAAAAAAHQAAVDDTGLLGLNIADDFYADDADLPFGAPHVADDQRHRSPPTMHQQQQHRSMSVGGGHGERSRSIGGTLAHTGSGGSAAMASTNVPLTALLSGGATGRLSAAARYGNNGSSQFGAPFGQQHHPRSLSQSPGGGAGIRLRPGPVGLARDDTVIGPTSRGGTGATGAEDGPALATGAGGVDRDGPSGSAADEGEPLLFDMSEIGRDGRRSIEEQRQQQQQPHLRGGTGGGGASGSGAASRYGGAGTGSHRGASGARW